MYKRQQYYKLYYLYSVNQLEPMSYKQPRLTDKETELIQAIRNNKRSYPNGALNLYHYAQEIFQELMEIY